VEFVGPHSFNSSHLNDQKKMARKLSRINGFFKINSPSHADTHSVTPSRRRKTKDSKNNKRQKNGPKTFYNQRILPNSQSSQPPLSIKIIET